MLKLVTAILQAIGLRDAKGKPVCEVYQQSGGPANYSSHPAFSAKRVARIVMSPGDPHFIIEHQNP